MSLMRHPVYVFGDGPRVHIWGRADADQIIPLDLEEYPDFSAGLSIPIEVWDHIVEAYLAAPWCSAHVPDSARGFLSDAQDEPR